jgi:dihydrofolate reductase
MVVTIDGFVCGSNGELDWFHRYIDDNGNLWMEKCLWGAGVHIMGRKSFEDMADYWPKSADSLSDPMNTIPKVVFTKQESFDTSKYQSSWSQALVASDLISEIESLKQQPGKYILAHGGASFAQDLVFHDLIDEYRLVTYPVILGKGKSLFEKAQKQIDLKLIDLKSYSSGIIIKTYQR